MTAAALGALIGLILAFTGAGGGILAIPLLVLVLHLPVQEAGPVGLAAVGIASAAGALMGLRQHVVRYRAAGLIGAMGMLSAPLGVALAQRLPNRPLMVGFALVMSWLAWRTLRPQPALSDADAARLADRPCHASAANGRLVWTSPCARALAGTGALSGLLSGLIGVGGGFVIVPALMRHTDLDIRNVQATSLAVIALVSISGVTAAALHGAVNWPVALPFALGASAALLIGQRVAQRLQARLLTQAFAWVSLLVAALMLLRAFGRL
jgi:uncharacterized membrane protein YfcA